MGDNQFEAVVKDASGKPVDDADVTLQLSMPAHTPPRKRIGRRLASFYGQLVEPTPSPVIEVNCAMAVSMAFGAAAGLVEHPSNPHTAPSSIASFMAKSPFKDFYIK